MPAAAADRSAELLEAALEGARRRGFVGPGPVRDHIDHARSMAAAVEAIEPALTTDPAAAYLDLGSGAGLPGLYLATRWRSRGALLDSNRRRCAFLRDAVAALDVADRVEVVEARAEVAARETRLRGSFTAVLARSFAGPAVTAECATGFLAPGGILAVSDPPLSTPMDAAARWDAEGLAGLGLEQLEVVTGARAMALFRKVGESHRWPRRDGLPAKRPLWRA